MYSLQTSLIILGMVISGTARSVGVKIFYQLGCDDNPLFVALLYLVGQSMALIVYGVTKYCQPTKDDDEQHDYAPVNVKELEEDDDDSDNEESTADDDDDDSSDELSRVESQSDEGTPPREAQHTLSRCHSDSEVPLQIDHMLLPAEAGAYEIPLKSCQSMPLPKKRRRGSATGLTQESQEAVAWVHSIPWQLKPLIPGLFNLANAALKWASFVYVAASMAEMLMSGLELVLSVMVARLVRKRQVSSGRWTGVTIVAIGLATVHIADFWDSSQDDNDASRRTHMIGAMLIVGQCVTAVGQDMAEELFLQEADFPATLLLGMEGIFGLIFGIPLYLQYAPETPMETWTNIVNEESNWKLLYVIFLMFVFTVTGIFNIMTTGVTSSMTRNMWKNCRTLLVWVVGLIIYYAMDNNDALGEEWVVPDSFFILGGFLLMLLGIYVYYKNK